ncbi:MAG: hypothetical protein WCR63_04725 [Bacilli bacterium]
MKKAMKMLSALLVLSTVTLGTLTLASCDDDSAQVSTSISETENSSTEEIDDLTDYNFEAENATLTPSDSEATGIELIHVDDQAEGASGGKAVGWVQKNDSVTWGINTTQAGDYTGSLVVSHPLKWSSTTFAPVSFRLDDIYSLIVNGEEVEVDGYYEFDEDPSEHLYDYYYWVDIDIELPLIEGDNVITLKKTARNNDYGSTGNIDTLVISSPVELTYFDAEPAAEPELAFDLNVSKVEFEQGEDIMVSAKNRDEHETDCVALYKSEDLIDAEGMTPLYKYYPAIEGTDEVNLLNFATEGREDERPLAEGDYTIYLLGDDGVLLENQLMSIDITITKSSEISDEISLTTDKDTYVQGESIMVTATVENETDWVAIYKADDEDLSSCGGSLYYYYPMAKGNGTAVDITTTIMNQERAEADLRAGDYIIYLLENNGYDVLLQKEITIESAEEVEHPYIALDKSIYSYSDDETRSIMVSVTPRTDHPKDWVALMKEEDDITASNHGGGSLFYFYANDVTSPCDITTMNPHSERLEDIKLLPGKYQVHYLADDGYEVLDTVHFTIAEK